VKKSVRLTLIVLATTLILLLIIYIHELFHILPCYIAGLNPEIHFGETKCYGINSLSLFLNLLYYFGPYIYDILLYILLIIIIKKYNFIKYLIFYPLLDILINFLYPFLGFGPSDLLLFNRDIFPNDKIIIPWLGIIMIFLVAVLIYKLSREKLQKEIWCRIGLHDWGKTKHSSLFSSKVRDYEKRCLKCGKVKTWVEDKKVEDWE
jgi:hypothetical protein